MPWVHLNDMLGIIHFYYAEPMQRRRSMRRNPSVNQSRFGQTLGACAQAPGVYALPGFVLKAALGEMAGLLLTGQNAVPEKLKKAG